MSHQFCVKCGQKNTYEASPPNFCCGCGEPFNKAISVARTETKEEERSGPLHIDKNKLKKDFVAEVDQVQRDTFGDLYHNPSPRESYTRPRPKSLGDNAAKATRQECAPVKGTKEIGVDR